MGSILIWVAELLVTFQNFAMTLSGKSTLLRAFCSVSLLGVVSWSAHAQERVSCAAFQETIKGTYNFRPAQLANQKERDQKSAAMDRFWESVKARTNELLPCLRQALEDPKADAWFLFDGSNLLVSLDPSDSSKNLQIKNYTATNLEDVDLRVWVRTLAARGVEGFDVSAAGERWLSFPKARYFLPEHGAFEVNVFTGGLFIFGSMDEALATPALVKMVNQSDHPGREVALAILLDVNTHESLQFLKQLDVSRIPSRMRMEVKDELTRPALFKPRSNPKTTRKEFLDAFGAFLNGDPSVFIGLITQVSDGERDVVATLTTEDLPLIRKVRRRIIAGGNQHSIEFYGSFTKIIRTILRKNESKS